MIKSAVTLLFFIEYEKEKANVFMKNDITTLAPLEKTRLYIIEKLYAVKHKNTSFQKAFRIALLKYQFKIYKYKNIIRKSKVC